MKKAIASLVASFVLILSCGQFVSAYSAITNINVEQKVLFSNSSALAAEVELDDYVYQLETVTDNNILAVDVGCGQAFAGDLNKIHLTETTFSFGDLTIPSLVENLEVDFNLNITVDNTFTTPGDYRYILRNTTTNEFYYLDLFAMNQDGGVIIGSYVFYSSSDFTNVQEKLDYLEDKYLYEDSEPTLYDLLSIFRFEDESGNIIREDINLTGVLAVPNKPDVSRKTYTTDDVNVALNQYESTLQNLLSSGYIVVSDDVAAHTGDNWFSDDPDVILIYHVVLRAGENPPPPAVVVTATPTPTLTPTPTPEIALDGYQPDLNIDPNLNIPGNIGIPNTGDYSLVYFGIIGIIGVVLMTSAIIIMKRVRKLKQ